MRIERVLRRPDRRRRRAGAQAAPGAGAGGIGPTLRRSGRRGLHRRFAPRYRGRARRRGADRGRPLGAVPARRRWRRRCRITGLPSRPASPLLRGEGARRSRRHGDCRRPCARRERGCTTSADFDTIPGMESHSTVNPAAALRLRALRLRGSLRGSRWTVWVTRSTGNRISFAFQADGRHAQHRRHAARRHADDLRRLRALSDRGLGSAGREVRDRVVQLRVRGRRASRVRS